MKNTYISTSACKEILLEWFKIIFHGNCLRKAYSGTMTPIDTINRRFFIFSVRILLSMNRLIGQIKGCFIYRSSRGSNLFFYVWNKPQAKAAPIFYTLKWLFVSSKVMELFYQVLYGFYLIINWIQEKPWNPKITNYLNTSQ